MRTLQGNCLPEWLQTKLEMGSNRCSPTSAYDRSKKIFATSSPRHPKRGHDAEPLLTLDDGDLDKGEGRDGGITMQPEDRRWQCDQ